MSPQLSLHVYPATITVIEIDECPNDPSKTKPDIVCCDGTLKCTGDECPQFTQSGKLEVCFALDESGSVCSTSALSACSSSFQSNSCAYNGFSDRSNPGFCPKFNTNTKGFVKDFMVNMDATALTLGATTRYAVVTFSSNADLDQNLQDAITTEATISGLAFEGGLTSTADGIEACRAYLLDGEYDADKLLVLITDGTPRKSGVDQAEYKQDTQDAADVTKLDGIKIIGIGVQTFESDLGFVEDLASDNLSFSLSDGYESLEEQVGQIVQDAITSSCGDE